MTGIRQGRAQWSASHVAVVPDGIGPSQFFSSARRSIRDIWRGHATATSGLGLSVRLANSGAWGRFVAEYLSAYRVQPGSVTTAGRGMDVHRFFELAEQLVVPPEAVAQKRRRFAGLMMTATIRYARDGERAQAWRAFLSPQISWRQRLSVRGILVLAMLSTPRPLWLWTLR